MKNYYIAQFRVIVDGIDDSIETVGGLGYDPNIVKGIAEKRAREKHPEKRIAVVLLSKKDMDLEEFKIATGGNPGWLGGPLQE
jgi:hypothetical protein